MARDERGQNLVEFAIVTLVLLLILAGIADLGRAFYTYMAVSNAAREGVRLYSRLPCTSPTASAIQQAVINATVNEAAANGIDLTGGVTLDPDPTAACPAAGVPVKVTGVYTYQSMLGALPLLGGGDYEVGAIQLRHTATMINFGADLPSPSP